MRTRFGLDTQLGMDGIECEVTIDKVTYQSTGGKIARMGEWYVCLNHTEGRYRAHSGSYAAALHEPQHSGKIHYTMHNLTELSVDENPAVRRYVAEHPHTPVDVLVTLSTDKDWQVRRYVAQNPNTPVDVLVTMSTDSDDWVRRDVAKNPNTPVDVLAVLSTDSNAQVRDAVVNK